MDALQREIEFYGNRFKNQLSIGTVFLGGGTPSIIKKNNLKRIIEAINSTFKLVTDAEISLEANPGTLTPESLDFMRKIGFNRISLGVQTSQQRHFDLMGRIHNFSDAINAFFWARKAGFDNINFDLIYGLPDQTLSEWQETIEKVLKFRPQHFSLYALGIEEGTPLDTWVNRGIVSNPDDDLAAEMYEYAENELELCGYKSYEISNFRLLDNGNDWKCRHNLQYWRNKPYLGLGAGAHGYIKGYRTENVNQVPHYISLLSANSKHSENFSPVVKSATQIDEFTEMQETMMVGLRLTEEGVSIEEFINRFHTEPQKVFPIEIDELKKSGLIDTTEKSIRLSKKGVLLGNLVFQKFVN
jgi:oxygen-independent coproporphyrinogen-3 oxidase